MPFAPDVGCLDTPADLAVRLNSTHRQHVTMHYLLGLLFLLGVPALVVFLLYLLLS